MTQTTRSTSRFGSGTHNFNKLKLVLARKRRGLSQEELAQKCGIDRRSIAGFEVGQYSPSEETLVVLGRTLDFPVEFFFGKEFEVPSVESVSFRSLSKMRAHQRDMALSQGALAIEASSWIERRYTLPLPDVPDLSHEPDPESAAIALRYFWNWGERPIANMIHLLESKGIRVFSLSIDAREVDAFSLWQDDTPFVFLNTQKSAERSRFDAAHELGHLVMHRHSSPEGRQAERDADAFASAFLMPADSILANAPRIASLPRLIELKRIWKVSLAALVYRLHSLDLISDWNYRSLFKDISSLKYNRKEPNSIPRETSKVFDKLAELSGGSAMSELLSSLCISQGELHQLTFGHSLGTLRPGTKRSTDSDESGRPKLKLVK